MVWGSMRLMESVNCFKPAYASITCSKIKHTPYSLIKKIYIRRF